MGSSISRQWTQWRPPKPQFTEKNVDDLSGKVYIISGSNTGIGKIVAQILYSKNAKVYMAARSEQKAKQAMQDIQKECPSSKGSLVYMHLDLNDLTTIKASAESFLSKEDKLHVLFNNAGVMVGETSPLITPQGYETSIGVNCLATFLFTKLLTPTLVQTAKSSPQNSVRVVWLASFGVDLYGKPSVAIDLDNLDYHVPKPATERYGISKVGNWLYGVEFAKRYQPDGVISIPINPGNLRTELARNQNFILKFISGKLMYASINGAYTELFAAFSPDITVENSGSYVFPFGRLATPREDMIPATKSVSEGGTGTAEKFWDWSEGEVKKYL